MADNTIDYGALARKHGAIQQQGAAGWDKVAASAQAPAGAEESWLTSLAKGVWSQINPVPMVEGLVQMTQNPVGTVKGMAQAQDAVRVKAEEAFRNGDYATGVRHAIGWLLPVLGPSIDAMGDKAQKGQVAEAVGEAAGFAVTQALGARGKPVQLTPGMATRNAADASAARYGQRVGIPVDAATATGNRAVRALQWSSDSGALGALVGERARIRGAKALSKEAERLAERAHATPAIPESAGADVRGALEGNRAAQVAALEGQADVTSRMAHPQAQTRLQAGRAVGGGLERRTVKLKEEADMSYGTFREIEELPANIREVQVGMDMPAAAQAELDALSQALGGSTFSRLDPARQASVLATAQSVGIQAAPTPIMQRIAMPVDLRPVKDALKPMYAEMTTYFEPARKASSPGYTAIKAILEGPDVVSASVAERGLSGLKELAREGKYANAGGAEFAAATRDVNQGAGAAAVKLLQNSIDSAVASAPEDSGRALAMLRRGRTLTRGKIEVADLVKQLRDEPVEAFTQLTHANDGSIEYLRQVAKNAPAEMAKVGRAWLDEVLHAATAPDDLANAKRLWASGQKLGPETKKILFKEPAVRNELDNLFGGLKSHADNPGPLKGMPTEPVGVYRQLLLEQDAHIDLLRAVQSEAPAEMGKLGRAYLQDVFGKARATGDFSATDAIFSDWQKLGPKTKEILYPNPLHRQDLNDFFLLAKNMGKNPNPSGTAFVMHTRGGIGLALLHPATGVPLLVGEAALSKMLHSPRGVKALMEGLKAPAGAASTIAAGQIVRIAGDDAKETKDKRK